MKLDLQYRVKHDILKRKVISMYLKRKIDTYLSEWKKTENRLPLIIKGARQIGKTGREYY